MHCNVVQARATLPTTTMTTTTTTKGRYVPVCFGERLHSAHELQHRLVSVWHGGKCVPSHERAWTTHQAAVERLAGGHRHGRVAVQVAVRVHRPFHFTRVAVTKAMVLKKERKRNRWKRFGRLLTPPTTERAPPRRCFRRSLPLLPPARR